jgi:auxin-responsive protein IAA
VLRARVVGWPPVRSYRKNALADVAGSSKAAKKFVKVAVDGAPYLRKVDLEAYDGYDQLLRALQDKFFAHFTIRQYTATYLHLSMSGFPLLCPVSFSVPF